MSNDNPNRTEQADRELTVTIERLRRMAAITDFLRERSRLRAADSQEWEKAGDKVQAAYNNGMSFAYHNVENFLTGANYL